MGRIWKILAYCASLKLQPSFLNFHSQLISLIPILLSLELIFLILLPHLLNFQMKSLMNSLILLLLIFLGELNLADFLFGFLNRLREYLQFLRKLSIIVFLFLKLLLQLFIFFN